MQRDHTRDHTPTPIPAHIVVQQCPAKIAFGAYKKRNASGGSAKPTAQIAQTHNRQALLNYAARGNR